VIRGCPLLCGGRVAACWWVRLIVESTDTAQSTRPSASAFTRRAAWISSQVPPRRPGPVVPGYPRDHPTVITERATTTGGHRRHQPGDQPLLGIRQRKITRHPNSLPATPPHPWETQPRSWLTPQQSAPCDKC
jgi:hypothetical protein